MSALIVGRPPGGTSNPESVLPSVADHQRDHRHRRVRQLGPAAPRRQRAVHGRRAAGRTAGRDRQHDGVRLDDLRRRRRTGGQRESATRPPGERTDGRLRTQRHPAPAQILDQRVDQSGTPRRPARRRPVPRRRIGPAGGRAAAASRRRAPARTAPAPPRRTTARGTGPRTPRRASAPAPGRSPRHRSARRPPRRSPRRRSKRPTAARFLAGPGVAAVAQHLGAARRGRSAPEQAGRQPAPAGHRSAAAASPRSGGRPSRRTRARGPGRPPPAGGPGTTPRRRPAVRPRARSAPASRRTGASPPVR